MTRRLWLAAMSLLAVAVLAAPRISAGQIAFAVDTGENLYSVDLSAATATLIGNTGVFLEGLALSPGGSLFGTDSGGGLWSIDKTTGAATFIGDTGRGNIEGLDYNGGTLLGSDFNDPPTIFSIDTTTAPTANIATASSSTGR